MDIVVYDTEDQVLEQSMSVDALEVNKALGSSDKVFGLEEVVDSLDEKEELAASHIVKEPVEQTIVQVDGPIEGVNESLHSSSKAASIDNLDEYYMEDLPDQLLLKAMACNLQIAMNMQKKKGSFAAGRC